MADKMLNDLVNYLKSYAKKNITKETYPYSYNVVKIEKKIMVIWVVYKYVNHSLEYKTVSLTNG